MLGSHKVTICCADVVVVSGNNEAQLMQEILATSEYYVTRSTTAILCRDTHITDNGITGNEHVTHVTVLITVCKCELYVHRLTNARLQACSIVTIGVIRHRTA